MARRVIPEHSERVRMLAKLFAIYPGSDTELRIRAYLDETADIPALVLSHGLKRIVQRREEYAPSVAEIRKECAMYLRERHRLAAGLDPHWMLPSGINVEAWIKRAAEPLPALPSGLESERATPEQRAKGAALLDGLVKSKGVRG